MGGACCLVGLLAWKMGRRESAKEREREGVKNRESNFVFNLCVWRVKVNEFPNSARMSVAGACLLIHARRNDGKDGKAFLGSIVLA
jgi:hypothetical protein